MSKSAFQQSYRAISWNVIGIGLGLINGILTARILLPEGRGILALVLTLGSIGALIAGMGTNVSFRALLPRGEAGIKNFLHVTLWLAPLSLVFGAAIAFWSLRNVSPDSYSSFSIIAIVLICVLSFVGIQGFDVLNAAGLNSKSAAANAAGNGLVSLFLLLSLLRELSLEGVLGCYVAAYSLRQMLVGYQVWRIQTEHELEVSGSESKIMRLGFQFMGLNVGQAFTFRIDLIFVELFRGASAAGIYTVAATPAAVLQVFSNTIGQVVFRRVADGSFGKRLVLQYLFFALTITILGGAFLFATSGWLILFLFGPEFADAVPLLRLFVLAEIFLAPYLVMSRAAAGLRMTWVASGSGVLGVVMMIATLLVFVPLFGAWGGAYACMVTYFMLSVFVCVPVMRKLSHD